MTFLPSEAPVDFTSPFAQDATYPSFRLSISEPLVCVGSLIYHVCGVPILYVIKFDHFFLVSLLMSIW